MRRVILTVPGCRPCEQLKKEYPDVPTLDLGKYPQVRFALQAMMQMSDPNDLAAPIAVAVAEGNGQQARAVLDLEA